jgi:hypothetical protein
MIYKWDNGTLLACRGDIDTWGRKQVVDKFRGGIYSKRMHLAGSNAQVKDDGIRAAFKRLDFAALFQQRRATCLHCLSQLYGQPFPNQVRGGKQRNREHTSCFMM